MNNFLVLKADKEAVFFPYLENSYMENMYKERKNIFDKLIFKFLMKYNLKMANWYFEDWKEKILEFTDVIIFDNGYSPLLSKYIKKKNPSCTIHFFLFNKIMENQTFFRDKYIDKIWTFDFEDAKKYTLKYNSTFFTKNIPLKNKNKCYDVTFLGAANNREKEILNIEEKLKKIKISTNFHIIKPGDPYVNYITYLNEVQRSSAILDITVEGQTGPTLRFMESIFLKRKIITNNKYAVNFDFYNKNNIFILDVDPIEKLPNFIASDFEEVKEEILSYYEYSSWLKRFLE